MRRGAALIAGLLHNSCFRCPDISKSIFLMQQSRYHSVALVSAGGHTSALAAQFMTARCSLLPNTVPTALSPGCSVSKHAAVTAPQRSFSWQRAGLHSFQQQRARLPVCRGAIAAIRSGTSAHTWQFARSLATTVKQNTPQQQGGISKLTSVKIVKWLVIGMIVVLSVRVMPYMGLGTVESALQLLSAETPFLQKAGASRLSTIASLSDTGAVSAIQGGAVPKLLHVLDVSQDEGVRQEVAQALLQLSKVPQGELALQQAGNFAGLQQVSDSGALPEADQQRLSELIVRLVGAARAR